MTDSKVRLPRPKPTDHPVNVGLRTEAAILSELTRRGYSVLVPWGVNQRYDLVLDLEGDLVRVQCKTGRLRKGVVIFSTQSIQCNTRRTVIRGYRGDAELFMVYCPDTTRVYCVLVESATPHCMYLRVDPTLNGQREGINWASDYELPG